MPESEYEVELFRTQGFYRKACASCGKFFWSLGDHSVCGERPCQEYDFIGNPPFKKKLTVRAMREDFTSYMEANGHTRVRRYPIVARWREDVFFTQASVYPFQPWVISGEASPPANPLVISQPCVRFVDIDNVGKTGQHFTLFEMMAHHAFNFPKKPIYWKDRTVELCHGFLTERLGLDPKIVRYKESWWQGGGNSGPCLEVVFGGAEAGTLVFMQNRDTNGHRVPMDTTVVDTGYGLERLVWLSQGTTSAYEAVFGDALAYLKRATGAKRVDDRILTEYSKVAGMFDVETMADVRSIRSKTAERLGISVEELVQQLAPLEALYVICDHSRALMFLLGDGVVPSNSREGYFARLLIRRGLRTLRNLNITYSMADTISFLIDQNREDYPELFFNKGDILKLLKVEEQRYRDTLEKGRATVQRLEERVKSTGGNSIGLGALIELYDSHGLTPDVVKEFATLQIEVPDDFYSQVARRHERPTEPEATKRIDLPPGLPTTRLRVYENRRKQKFRAKVVGIHGNAALLDQTFFYPEGGGQEADRGTIGGRDVTDVQRVGNVILHFLKGEPKFDIGKPVTCEIDWTRRTNLMRNHSGTHIVLGAARKVLGNHVWQTGAHKAEDLARLDITHYDSLTDQEMERIEELANDIVLSDAPVRVRTLPRDVAEAKYGFRLYQGGVVPGGELRVVEIPKWDIEACGGTHVARTSEVGVVKLLRTKRIQDGVVRLEYAAGKPALVEIRKQSAALGKVASSLSVAVDQVAPAVDRLVEEWREQRKELDRARQATAGGEASELVAKADEVRGVKVVVHRIAGSMKDLLPLSKQLAEVPNVVAILGAAGDTASVIVTRGRDGRVDSAAALAVAMDIVGGKGGGRPDFAQGGGPKVEALDAALGAAKREVLSSLTASG